MRALVPFLTLSVVVIGSATAGLVEDWNAAMVEAIRAENPPPALAARNLAMMHLAGWRTVKRSPHEAEAQLNQVSFEIAKKLYPEQLQRFEAVASRHGRVAEAKVALEEAKRMLDERSDDGASTRVHYQPSTSPGAWRRTGVRRPPETPHWGRVRPFFLKASDQFRPEPPPRPGSEAFAKALSEVRDLGGAGSAIRSEEQTMLARFWSDFSYTASPPGHWNAVARQVTLKMENDDLRAIARLYALLNVALADAAVAAFDAKYHYSFWRPETALSERTGWQSLLESPPHPEYVSGHSTFSGAAATVLEALLGCPEAGFEARSDTVTGEVRQYHCFHACAQEISDSRVWGGIHYRFSGDRGLETGRAVGKWCLVHFPE